jgi:hypothetical protein
MLSEEKRGAIFMLSTVIFRFKENLMQKVGSKDTMSQEVASKTEAFSDIDDLFADVQAVAFTDSETQDVEGDGILDSRFFLPILIILKLNMKYICQDSSTLF